MGQLGDIGAFDAVRSSALVVDSIETWAEFRALKTEWQALEARDPQATVFLSWTWLAQAFRSHPGRWRVLIVHRADRLICVLPLKYRLHWSESRQAFETEIEAGGRLLFSEYTGFLCDPTHEAQALDLVAGHLRRMPWARLSLRYVEAAGRAERFMRAFPEAEYSARFRAYRINGGETDNLICPQVPLPQDMESYAAGLPSRNRRQRFRRTMRRLEQDDALRVSVADTQSFDRDVSALLQLWRAKWAPSKGPSTAARVARNYRDVLAAALKMGCLYMPVLRRGDQVLGALGHVIDRHGNRLCFIVGGRDETASDPGIGQMLHGTSLRWAIEQGLGCYDFCHGDEAYKFTYGASARSVRYLTVRRRRDAAPANRLDPLDRADAMERTIGFVEGGDRDRAVRACQQLLETMRAAPT